MKTFQPKVLAVAAFCASLVACKSSQHVDVTIRWSDTKQTIDGFGASSALVRRDHHQRGRGPALRREEGDRAQPAPAP